MYRECAKCYEEKSIEEFAKRQWVCKSCNAQKERARRQRNKREEKVAHLRNPITEDDIQDMERNIRADRKRFAAEDKRRHLLRTCS